jgi:hypothetical protein
VNLNLDWLLPDDDRPPTVRRYRLRVAVVACVAFLGMWLVTWPAIFSFPFQLPGFVSPAWSHAIEEEKTAREKLDTDVKALADLVTATQVMLLEDQLLRAHENWCEAPGRATGWAMRVDDLKKRYRQVTKDPVPALPDCNRM